jgi:hypothetical protein
MLSRATYHAKYVFVPVRSYTSKAPSTKQNDTRAIVSDLSYPSYHPWLQGVLLVILLRSQ